LTKLQQNNDELTKQINHLNEPIEALMKEIEAKKQELLESKKNHKEILSKIQNVQFENDEKYKIISNFEN
jgi:predicted  nucleic acid-binding Zn-ribbon protein